MIAEGPIVKGWAASTAPKIVQLLDQFVINYPQANVRKTTTKLLASLFKKGNQEQRANIIKLLIDRLQHINSMGKSSEEFLCLIGKIFELFPNDFLDEKMLIFNEVLSKVKQIFSKVTQNKQYEFYSLCSNMIDFGQEFKPYLLEANGCLKCFGRPDVDFQHLNINSIRQELRVHINNIEWVLKRKYEMNNLTLNFIKKKINFKTLIVYYLDDQGVKVELGKYTPNDVIPPYNITTNTIGITFQFHKIRRSHIACMLCSANEQYAVLCSNCVGKIMDIEGSVKVVSGNPSKINKQLIESFKTLNQLKGQLASFAISVSHQSKISQLKIRIVSEMETCYSSIIQNIRLLRNLNENQLKAQKEQYGDYIADCYSCHFFELASCINFVSQTLKKQSFKIEPGKLNELILLFKNIYLKNRVHSLNDIISSILSELFNRVISIDYLQQIEVNKQNCKIFVQLLVNFISHIKTHHKENSELLQKLKAIILDKKINGFFSIAEKVEIFVTMNLPSQHFGLLSESKLEIQKLQDIQRFSSQSYAQNKTLLDFEVRQILQHNITNIYKIFLMMIPKELIPVSSLDIVDPAYLKYVKNEPPVITEELILSNIVYTPNPIIKLNLFKLLPQIIQNLPLEDSIEIIKQLCKYKHVWNTYIRETVQTFNQMLESVEKQRKLMLCLEGYDSSKENFYFDHIYKILTPQRPNFIIRLEIPDKEMQKEEKNKGGPVQYIYLPIRQVKSEDLKSDTIGALHEWITDEVRKIGQDMPFDLIAQGYIIDDLSLSLEIIYKKIIQKQAKRQIGNKTYDFFRVIYRIQGIFGQANERNCGQPRDEKREECTQFCYNLMNKIPNKKTGLDVLMEIVPSLDLNTKEAKDKKEKIIKILEIIFKNEVIVQKIVEQQHSYAILNLAIKSISLNRKHIKQTENLLHMCQKIIDQANHEMIKIRKNSGAFDNRKASEAEMDIEVDSEQSLRTVKFVLDRVKEAEEGGFKEMGKKLIKMLPFCTKDDMASSKYLFEFFQVNKVLDIKFPAKLPLFLEFISALSESYISFKQICMEEGITNKVSDQIAFGLNLTQTEIIKENLENIETSLVICRGLLLGDIHLQEELFKKQILQLIYRAGREEKMKVGKIPSLCFDFEKYFLEGKMMSPHIQEYFLDVLKKKKQSVESNRKKKLQAFKDKGKRALKGLSQFFTESSNFLNCSSCKEGGKGVIGIYVYSTKIDILPLDGWWKDHKKMQAITSTSYFEPIHLECHIRAMKNDPKPQWEGALIRNSEVICNNWCPIKGPETSDEDFDKAMKKYFEKNNKSVSFWVVINDLNGLLERFSKEFNFAQETKGSSYSHNAKLIPVLIQFACHLLRNNEEIKFVKEGIAFVEEHMTKKSNTIHLYFCLLLFSTPSSSFKSKKEFCLRLIDNLDPEEFKEFKDKKPFYIELAMIQSILKIIQSTSDIEHLTNHLDQYITKNFNNILEAFEGLAEVYKDTFAHWEKLEQVKEYFKQ